MYYGIWWRRWSGCGGLGLVCSCEGLPLLRVGQAVMHADWLLCKQEVCISQEFGRRGDVGETRLFLASSARMHTGLCVLIGLLLGSSWHSLCSENPFISFCTFITFRLSHLLVNKLFFFPPVVFQMHICAKWSIHKTACTKTCTHTHTHTHTHTKSVTPLCVQLFFSLWLTRKYLSLYPCLDAYISLHLNTPLLEPLCLPRFLSAFPSL